MSRTEQLHVTVQGYECLGIKEGSRIVITWGDADQAKIAKVETKIHRNSLILYLTSKSVKEMIHWWCQNLPKNLKKRCLILPPFFVLNGFSNVSRERFVIGTGYRRILRLRNENKTVSDGIISASRTDSSSGATETVQISYVP